MFSRNTLAPILLENSSPIQKKWKFRNHNVLRNTLNSYQGPYPFWKKTLLLRSWMSYNGHIKKKGLSAIQEKNGT